jgi:hypothetical protein
MQATLEAEGIEFTDDNDVLGVRLHPKPPGKGKNGATERQELMRDGGTTINVRIKRDLLASLDRCRRAVRGQAVTP